MLLIAGGCWPFHKESPQQQYTEALMRGNSMQASQIWLNMKPEDRMKFARGEGINPNQETTKKDVQQMMMNHAGQSDQTNADQTQESSPTPLGASLRQIPGLDSPEPSNQEP